MADVVQLRIHGVGKNTPDSLLGLAVPHGRGGLGVLVGDTENLGSSIVG
jgi:hypothetical protein